MTTSFQGSCQNSTSVIKVTKSSVIFKRGLVILKSLVKLLLAWISPFIYVRFKRTKAKQQRETRAKIFAGDFCVVFKIS